MNVAAPRGLPLLLLVAALVGGCSSPTYTLKPASGPAPCLAGDRAENPVFVGLAVSGGGTRAALFGEGGMEALGQLRAGAAGKSVLEQVSYVSAVSGGSMASSYFTLKKPGATVPVLAPGGAFSPEYTRFFADFRAAMSQDYEGPMIRRQLARFRGLNPAWTARSLAEILAEQHFGNATFGSLAEREARGDSPHLLVNTTLYNDGRRLVFSSLPPADLRFDFPAALGRLGQTHPMDDATQATLRQRWATLESLAPADLQLDACAMQLTRVMVASMSYPPYIGPITLRAGEQGPYWHIGDGGLADNSGTESLFMVALQKLQTGRARRAVIIAFDSSFPFDVGGKVLNSRAEGWNRSDEDFSRIPSIMEERANAYRALFIQTGQGAGMLPGNHAFDIVVMRHTDAIWRDDLADLPASCREEKVPWKTPEDVRAHLAELPTRLAIESACDRDLVTTAAAKVVAQNADRIRALLQ